MNDPEFQFYDLTITVTEEEGGQLYEKSVTPPVCDFCTDTRIRWEYDCATFIVGSFGSDDGWYACDRCSTLIEAGEQEMLLERSLESWRIRGMPMHPDLGVGLKQMQTGFFEHRQGERRAFG